MSFRYFAYGSNLWPPQMRSRCPSAKVVGTTSLAGWTPVYDKPSMDGSAKLNIRPDPEGSVDGVLYELEDGERQALDQAEPAYTPIRVELDGPVLTYAFEHEPFGGRPYDWYVATVMAGARHHGLDPAALAVDTSPDPVAPGVRPASVSDLGLIQDILSEGLSSDSDRYYVHPGDVSWWIHHDDPRHVDHFSMWIQGDSAFVVVDVLDPPEISVFARPGVDRIPLIEWSQRRLDSAGEVGWVSDSDRELVEALRSGGYRPVYSYRCYHWDLSGRLPAPELPKGWEIRAVSGEAEADNRLAAAHAAFQSTMSSEMHLQRYLDFMRSPMYVPERDLVAVAPDGTFAAFMIWWADERSGIAEIEPFGTHPRFQRQGIGRALLHHGLGEMRKAGALLARVCTEHGSSANQFYQACGFGNARPLRWWKRP